MELESLPESQNFQNNNEINNTKTPYQRQLTKQQKQAYQGAKMFYYCVLPFSMIMLVMFAGFLCEQGGDGVRDKVKVGMGWLLISIVSYVMAVWLYVKCNQIETYPAPLMRINKQTQHQTLHKITATPIQLVSTSQNHQNLYQQSSAILFEDIETLNPSLTPITKPMRHYCHKCDHQTQYRSKHCRKCNTCIERFDHHCFWIGNCVGRHNHKLFYLFLLTQSVNNFTEMQAILVLKQGAFQLQFELHVILWVIIYGMLLTTIGFFCFTGYLAVYHSMLIVLGITTWEQMRRQKITYLKYLPKGYNPFSIGWYNNIEKFFTQQTRYNSVNCQLQLWQPSLPTFQYAKTIKPRFNFIDNQYYSCC